MPFGRRAMDEKEEFVELASKPGVNKSELCRRFGISRSTGFQLLERYKLEGVAGLAERSRRPIHSPTRTDAALERKILELRDESHWGARKIAHVLSTELKLDIKRPTVHSILRRNDRIDDGASAKHRAWTRFQHEDPNDLWQIDFMGSISTMRGKYEPLTVIDDHSRFSLCLRACRDQRTETVQSVLTDVFSRYGLPWRMTMDNGSPWGDDGLVLLTKLTAWLIRLGIGVSHSRPYHPQTQGKDERSHRTIREELTNHVTFSDLDHLQRQFDLFQHRYNYRRPHESLGMQRPADRYRPSTRTMPKVLLPIEYGEGIVTRYVEKSGKIRFRGQSLRVGKGCAGMVVGLRPALDEKIEVYFCQQQIALIDMTNPDDFRVIRATRSRGLGKPGAAKERKS